VTLVSPDEAETGYLELMLDYWQSMMIRDWPVGVVVKVAPGHLGLHSWYEWNPSRRVELLDWERQRSTI
jgi:hypothetical protein